MRSLLQLSWLFEIFSQLLMTSFVQAEVEGPNPMLDYFLRDSVLWKLPTAEMEKRLKPEGYQRNPTTSIGSLGEPRDLMKRGCMMFGGVKIWNVQLYMGEHLNRAIFQLAPPPSLGQPLTKAELRTILQSVHDGLTAQLKIKPTPYLLFRPQEEKAKAIKPSAERWVGPELQAILVSTVKEAGPKIEVQELSLTLGAAATGEPMPLKPPTLKVDRASGTLLLQDLPGAPVWPGKNDDWGPLEQALAMIGKPCDRNSILFYADYGVPWPISFIERLHALCTLSGVKETPLIPNVWIPAENAKLKASCLAAGKKLSKPAPQTLENLLDLDPDVLRVARATPTVVAQFTVAFKKSLEARQPLYWYGVYKGLTQSGLPAGSGSTGVRLLIGLAEKEGEVICADAEGRPGPRMKIPDAIASSYLIQAITAK